MHTNHMRKAIYNIFIIAISLTVALSMFSLQKTYASPERFNIQLVYFYENVCSSCDPEGDFLKLYYDLIGSEKDDMEVNFLMYNVFHESGADKAKQYFSDYKVPKDEQYTPAVFIGDDYLIGEDVIQEHLREAFLETKKDLFSVISDESDTVSGDKQDTGTNINQNDYDDQRVNGLVVYFYTTACNECNETAAYFHSIENRFSKLKKYNIGNPEGLKLIKEYFYVYKVPEDIQSVPLVFIGDTYFSGAKNIQDGVSEYLEKDDGFTTLDLTEMINNEVEYKLTGYKLLGVITTGFINGLNPCSISMLLFFLSILIAEGIPVLKAGTSFIIGKLIVYVLMGTVLFNLLIQLEIPWFQSLVKGILIAFYLIIAILNFLDFFAARNEDYGKIRMQLPKSIRKRNHQWIKKLISIKDSKLMVFICFGLGGLIAAGELLCTGQIYLAAIIIALKNSPSFNLTAMIYFSAYGLAYVSPLILLMILFHKGREGFELSELYREKIHIIKLINAIVFLVFGMIALILF